MTRLKLPDLPKGYYWSAETPYAAARLCIKKRRRFWFDKVVTWEYYDIVTKYPESSYAHRLLDAAELIRRND